MKMKKMLSLMAAAAIAGSCVAGMATSASAADNDYAEWIFNDVSSTALAGEDATVDGTGRIKVTGTSYNASETLKAEPIIYFSRNTASSNANSSNTANSDQTYIGYSGTSYTQKKGWKMSANSNYGYTFTVNPMLEGNSAASYDLKLVYFANSGDSICKVADAGTDTVNTNLKNLTEIKSATASGKDSVQTLEVTGLTNNTVFGFSAQPGLMYIGIKYNAPSAEPSIRLNKDAATIKKGETVTLSATTENAGDALVAWKSDNSSVAVVDENGVVTGVSKGTAIIEASIDVNGQTYTASCDVTVNNTAALTYAVGETGAVGTVPEEMVVDEGTDVVIPVNRTLYVEGKTLTGWSDGTNTYAPGTSYTINSDVTMTPVFTDNTVQLGDAETTVVFDFQRQNGAPTFALQGNTGILVEQAVINGQAIDVKMDIDTTSGKLANANWDDWAQVNGGAKFTVPVVADSVVTVGDIYSQDGTYKINDVSKTGSNGSETITVAGTCDVVAGEPSGDYWRSITVTYPKTEVVKPDPVKPAVTVSAGEVVYENKAVNPAVLFVGKVTPNDYTVTGITWKYGIGTANIESDPMTVDISGETEVSYGLIVELKNDDAKAAKNNIKADIKLESHVTETAQN